MQVCLLLEQMSAEFEEAVQLGGGWTELALPSKEEAQRYFASFRRTPPDNSALVPGTQVASCAHIHCIQMFVLPAHLLDLSPLDCHTLDLSH
jgi:hypothetical protein